MEYRIDLMEDAIMAEVVLSHPDYSSEYHNICFASKDAPRLFDDDEEWHEYYQAVRKVIEHRYNRYGFWHEVKITMVCTFEDKVYRSEIKED